MRLPPNWKEGIKDIFSSGKYADYLKVMSRFHRYSLNNTLLIALQNPEASLVAGYHAWQKRFQRQVLKGESHSHHCACGRKRLVEKKRSILRQRSLFWTAWAIPSWKNRK